MTSLGGGPSRRIRVGLVGIGGYGARHLETVESLRRVQLVAVADPFRYPVLEDRFHAQGIHWYSSAEGMLLEEDLDAVAIAAPIPRHFSMARMVLRRGLPLYLEKPPVPLVQQLDELIALDAHRRVVVGFQMIHSDPVRRLKHLILDGGLGEILSIRGAASAPRVRSYYDRASWAGKMTHHGEAVFDGPMTNALAHILQNIMFLGGTDAQPANPVSVRGELYRAIPIESYDTACLSGTLDSGIEFAFAVTHACSEILPHTLEVVGTRHSARLEGTVLTSTASVPPASPTDEEEPLKTSFSGFFDYLDTGDQQRTVGLRDTRGFVLATNGALVSSGGIHSIPESYRQSYGQGKNEGIHVRDLLHLTRRCLTTGALFSDSGPAWAVPSGTVQLENFRSLTLSEWMLEPEKSLQAA